MTDTTHAPSGSAHLIAPELLPALDLLPKFELTDELLAAYRVPQPRDPISTPPPLTPEQLTVSCEERFIPGPAGAPDIRILVYSPPEHDTGRPAMLHMHGGGMIIGTPEINDGLNRDLVLAHGCVIVSVDYRLAPEARWQESYEDNYAALAWLFANADDLGIDRTRVAVAGESAGGGHAAALALRARDRGEYPICFQLLDCPMLDDRTGTPAGPPLSPFAGEFVWTAKSNSFAWRQLLGQDAGGADVPEAASPGRATDLAGLPPTFVAIGALDLFLEETLDYVRRLSRAGVPIELHVIPGAFHAYTAAGPGTPQMQALLRYRHDAIVRAFAR